MLLVFQNLVRKRYCLNNNVLLREPNSKPTIKYVADELSNQETLN